MRWVPLLSIILAGCAGNVRVDAEPKRDTGPILRVFGRYNLAHACPISERLAYTNAHVTDIRPFDHNFKAVPLIWSDGEGRTGTLFPVALDTARDLAVLRTDIPFTRHYQTAEDAPEPGARVWFAGYDWSSRDKALATKVFETAVNRVVAGHLVLKEAGLPGSSGSCVLDDSGRLVAINMGGIVVGHQDQVGIAVGVWAKLGIHPESAESPN